MEMLKRAARREQENPRPSVSESISTLALEPGMRVLDVGCGPGAHLRLFAERVAPGGHVIGLDISPERLKIANELNAKQIAECLVELREGNLHALPFDDGTFDVVWTSAVLHHEQAPVDVVQELARTVRDSGRVAVLDSDGGGSFPLVNWPPEFEQRLRSAALRAEHERYGDELPYFFTGYLGRRLPEILREAGLRDVQLHAFVDVECELDSERETELCNWFTDSFGKRLRRFLAPADFERLVDNFTQGSEAYLPCSPDFFVATTYYLCVGERPG